ncbi:prephenate dehydrogenase/arogenate dehydrogenase family protein [Rhodococcus sp. SGAir0479]|uniref:prephenate dehydrogenase/arogenate dehydrogenase family protein n=1 Tax=Rhodococcus sp. SGAir0479 TaxID=2567884 RepID=UPI0010CD19F9|nr:prephenate dehydrogenase/arogenate dehydrogenase family protein [Rhodococcus sp. SGAir0479]QCQ91124.1 prephenate dehydrogenase/arogenate dehydrogenase family protein [Rhodococcus sp. SGAir0479]
MTTHTTPAVADVVVVGGAGAVGGMLADLARSGGDSVTVIDRVRPARDESSALQGDVTAPSDAVRAAVATADTVILAVPDDVAAAAIPLLATLARPDALLVETLSVKTHIHRVLREYAPDRPAVGINPMFAPGLGMPGRPVAAVVHRGGPAVDRFLGAVGRWGGRVVTVDAAEHDRVAAATQALTHAAVLAFGLALADAGLGIDTLAATAPPPFTTMLSLLARVGGGAPAVYHDIQAGNPEAASARRALAGALSRLADTVEHGDDHEFATLMADAVRPLGDRQADYGRACAAVFAHLPRLLPEEGGRP